MFLPMINNECEWYSSIRHASDMGCVSLCFAGIKPTQCAQEYWTCLWILCHFIVECACSGCYANILVFSPLASSGHRSRVLEVSFGRTHPHMLHGRTVSQRQWHKRNVQSTNRNTVAGQRSQLRARKSALGIVCPAHCPRRFLLLLRRLLRAKSKFPNNIVSVACTRRLQPNQLARIDRHCCIMLKWRLEH